MSHWMFSCKEISRRVSDSMDHDLYLHQRIMIRIHLLMCRYCARFRRQMVLLRELSRSHRLYENFLDPRVTLSTDARQRIRQTLKSSFE